MSHPYQRLSIIIPAFNERETIAEVLKRVCAVDVGLEKEILVLDGCSDDGTRELLQEIATPPIRLILEEKRMGKGAAVRRGFQEATGDILLIQDADLELHPREFPALIAPILQGEAQVVFGSRFSKGRGDTNQGSYLGNRIVTWATNLLFGTRLTDMCTGHKVFQADFIRSVPLVCNGFDFDAELTTKILRRGLKILEVPVAYAPRDRQAGKKLHWSAGFRVLFTILRYRFLG